MYKEW
jgi:hypothetical protein